MQTILLMDWTLEYWVCGILGAIVIAFLVFLFSGSDGGMSGGNDIHRNDGNNEPEKKSYYEFDPAKTTIYTGGGIPINPDDYPTDRGSSGEPTAIHTPHGTYKKDANGNWKSS
jgi:hypothetical protein